MYTDAGLNFLGRGEMKCTDGEGEGSAVMTFPSRLDHMLAPARWTAMHVFDHPLYSVIESSFELEVCARRPTDPRPRPRRPHVYVAQHLAT